ncbi:MAG: type II toxin-antitoxin system PemK/MazF family toxin [Candidatus Paceibacterota bacterium]
MGKVTYIPDRGDIIKLDFSPTKGHEQRGYRPALVISAKKYNAKTKRAVVCPMTSKILDYPFVTILKSSEVSGSILLDQIRSVDWNAREVTFIMKASNEVLEEATDKLIALIA